MTGCRAKTIEVFPLSVLNVSRAAQYSPKRTTRSPQSGHSVRIPLSPAPPHPSHPPPHPTPLVVCCFNSNPTGQGRQGPGTCNLNLNLNLTQLSSLTTHTRHLTYNKPPHILVGNALRQPRTPSTT